MVDTVVNLGDFVFFEVSEGERFKREEMEQMGGEDGESLVGVGDVGVLDGFQKFHDYKLTNRVLDIDAVGNALS